MTFEIRQGDYSPLCYITAYRDGGLVHRRLIERKQIAVVRAELERRYA